jgi:flagellar motility protein MotE (MotC chaperone)
MNPDAPAVAGGEPAKVAPKTEAFLRLLHAYENMEPESAAKAIAQLAVKDKEAVVQMMLGWKPRTSGQILDALTQFDPSLAADLSYEVWKRSGEAAS